MAFNLYATSPTGRGGPARGLEIPLRFNFMGGVSTHAFLLDIVGALQFAGRTVSSNVRVAKIHFQNGAHLAVFARGTEVNGAVFAALSREAIRFIDERRGRDDLRFSMALRLTWQEADEVPPQLGGRMGYKLGPIYWSEQTPNWDVVPSSTWKRCLEQMEYAMREVIEIPRIPFASDAALSQAIQFVKSAEEHARDGDWRDVLTNCRLAFESIARYEAPGNTKRGFELLFARAYRESDTVKRERMNGLIREIRELCNALGAHIDSPVAHPTRSEALLTLSATASLIATLGHALEEAESLAATTSATSGG